MRELLATVDSRELSEWQAYERATGPLGSAYNDHRLAEIADLLQLLLQSWLSADSGFTPSRTVRPAEVFAPPADAQEGLSLADFDRDMGL